MICSKHNEEKVTYKNGQKECRSCNREWQSVWWNKNKIKQQERVKKNRNRLQDVIIEIKENSKCFICDEKNPMILEFDHIENKKETVSEMVRIGVKPETIKNEICKCRILCSNCHQIKTHIENDSYVYNKYKIDERYSDKIEKIKLMMEMKEK
jgi:hypothetical protein